MGISSPRAFVMGLVAGVVVVGAPVGRYAYIVTQQKGDLESQVMDLQARNGRMQQAGQQLLAKAQQLAKRDLPVSILYRQHVLFVTGAQLIIKNNSVSDLPITAEFDRPDSPSVTREVVVPANGSVTQDSRQGWAFEPGDSIKLHNPEYRDWINPSIRW
ncbi:MAG TPA: hypothetical protein VHY19_09880 [Steroidobacteraceae bacterium]|jgi:hypothetical protein|nr:hypothetical protein [Steroidobacteraceae bacterium]